MPTFEVSIALFSSGLPIVATSSTATTSPSIARLTLAQP
jgi:hypothetical protein